MHLLPSLLLGAPLAVTVRAIPLPWSGSSFFRTSWSDAASSYSSGSSSGGSSGTQASGHPPFKPAQLSESDKGIINLLLTAENLEANLYREGLKKFPDPKQYEAAFPNLKDRNVFEILKLVGAQENDHRVLLNEALKATGSEALFGDDLVENAKQFDFGSALDSVKSWVSTIAQIEGGGTSGYLAAVGALENEELRNAARAIATIEARHNAIGRYLFSTSPSPVLTDTTITPADVVTLLGGLMSPTLLSQLAFKPHPTLTASVTTANPGGWVSFQSDVQAQAKAQGKETWCAWQSSLIPVFSNFTQGGCNVPTSPFLGGQTYVAVVKTKNFTDDAILFGPTIIELPPANGLAKFPPEYDGKNGSVLNAQLDQATVKAITDKGLSQSDQDVANLLLTAENLESNLYKQGLAKFSNDASYQKSFGFSGLFKILSAFGSHENDHRVALGKVLDAAGATKVLQDVDNGGKFDYGKTFDSIESFIKTIGQIEGGGASGYEGAVGAIQNPAFRALAASIMTIEARHNTFLRFLQKQSPNPGAYDATITPADVLTLVGGLIDKEILAKLAFKAHKPLTVTSTDTPKQGGTLTFSGVDLAGAPQAWCAFLSQLVPQFSPYDSTKSSCSIPTSPQLGGQTYLAIVTKESFDDASIVNGPTIVELGAQKPFAPLPLS